ncbi:thiol-disulfide isomerase [Lactococcus nasutitermitis]|uniref:Thiol-disulfide isomerase n=1 Tax=Lactococcus nasutitermitis TaxID=1652957 RepID=A0ABV9JF08_9LACT|nr:thiol-disulfide isomerase [Lactococcus nasutitermitis]
MITLNINHLGNAEIFWRELGLEDEIALNETENPTHQTLAVSVEYIDEIHDKLIELDIPTSPITATADGNFMFSFLEPEGNTIIIIGEWVEEPYAAEKRAEFFDNMKNVEILPLTELSNLTETTFILFGRVTCPWTRRFARQLPTVVTTKIAYIDTEDTDINPQLQSIREQYNVPTVPTFIKRFSDGSFEKFDKKVQRLTDFVK